MHILNSRYILDHPSFFKNLNILDIGCGCGACSIAAFLAGAKQVIANDVDDGNCSNNILSSPSTSCPWQYRQ